MMLLAIWRICLAEWVRELCPSSSSYDKFPAKECANGETRPLA
jgi:hypothetical protein